MCCFISSSSSSFYSCECVCVCVHLFRFYLSLIFSLFLSFYFFHSAWQSPAAPLDFRHAFDEDAPRGSPRILHGSAIGSRHITRSRRKFESGHCLNGSRGFPLGLDTSRRLFMEHLWRSACFGPG